MCSPTNSASSSSTPPSSSSHHCSDASANRQLKARNNNNEKICCRRSRRQVVGFCETTQITEIAGLWQMSNDEIASAYYSERRIASDSRKTFDPTSRGCARDARTTTTSAPNVASSISPLTTCSTSFRGREKRSSISSSRRRSADCLTTRSPRSAPEHPIEPSSAPSARLWEMKPRLKNNTCSNNTDAASVQIKNT